MLTASRKGFSWLLIVSFMIIAMPMFALADASEANIEKIKQLRQTQNQGVKLKNLQSSSTAVSATPEQERMLRLSNALSRLQQQPDMDRDHVVNLRRTDRDVPVTRTSASRDLRDVMYGSGRMTFHPDSMYFNFLTGMNGSDTTGMDVRITGNEMLNFGNEGANYSEPSMLYYLTPDGSLGDITEVDAIDDPSRIWTDISWDWQGGNSGAPLAVGNLWVVFARTSQMYVVLEVTAANPDWANPSFSFDYMIQTDGSPVFDGMPTSIIYNSGAMFKRPDSLYFNFLDGLMGGDTLGMDVMISGNEGTNFGSESTWINSTFFPGFSDPSQLFFYSPMGSLDTVSVVPSIEDPLAQWTDISWDWQGGNGGQPLAVGNLWVVYTRTSNMYVVLEVTDVSVGWSDNWFTFDYMIQTDGSNVFEGGVVEPSNYTMTTNGQVTLSLPIGSIPYVEINLDGNPGGEFGVFWDGNDNGMLDDTDIALEFYPFMDNDMHDEDMAPGVFGFTYTDEMADGLNYLVDDLIFATFSGDDFAFNLITFTVEPSPYSVSGMILANDGGGPPLEDIVVWAVYDWADMPSVVVLTNGAGQYHLDLPDTGMVWIGTEDYFMRTDGLMPDPSGHRVHVMGAETGYNFIYLAPTSGIEGFVYDELGNGLSGVEVKAGGDGGPGGITTTNESGYYYIGVIPGWYDVGVDFESLPSPYMVPHTAWVGVDADQVVNVDFTLHSANNSIVGTVTLDGAYWEGATVVAMNEFGFSYTMSSGNGYFDVPVHGGPENLYDLMVWNGDMPDVVQVSNNRNIPAGAEGVSIVMETLTGGLFGYFMDTETNQPIMNTDQVGMMMRDSLTGAEFYGGPDQMGYYELRVPPGTYEVMAGGYEWMGPEPITLTIGEEMIQHDFWMTHMAFDASLDGFVYDSYGSPIPYAQVQIGNEGWGAGMMTDQFGHFYFDLPVGYYYISAWADGYIQQFHELAIRPGANNFNFFLPILEVDGAIAGQVTNFNSGIGIPGANVYAYGYDDQSYWTDTDPQGNYWFNLPNGMYDVVVEHPEYPPLWQEGVNVMNDTTYVNFALRQAEGGVNGYVRNNMGDPIWDAQVVIISVADSMLGFWGYTDENGYYSIPAFNGEYAVIAGAPGYDEGFFGNVTIADNWVGFDITLTEHEFAVAPHIEYIMDQPNDQGRWVRMQFRANGTEWGPFHSYSIWRMTNTPFGPIVDFVDYLPHHGAEFYNVVLPTLVDSSAYVTDPVDYVTGFVVTGHWDMYGFIDGDPGAGYSIDNIHPGVPSPLVLLAADPSHVDMQWEASMDDDFQYFEVHRANSPVFNAGTVVEMTTATGWTDLDLSVGQTYYYQVVAVDASGNKSGGSNVINTTIVSVDEAETLPTVYALSQNYPNPFNPTTTIAFALPEAADVNLVIYNILGQKVRTLVNGHMPAGYITTSWDGLDQNGRDVSSGTYIYRLEAAGHTFTRKMVFMK